MVDARLYKPCQFKDSKINTMLMMMKMSVAAVRMMVPHFGDIIFVLGSYKDRGVPLEY